MHAVLRARAQTLRLPRALGSALRLVALAALVLVACQAASPEDRADTNPAQRGGPPVGRAGAGSPVGTAAHAGPTAGVGTQAAVGEGQLTVAANLMSLSTLNPLLTAGPTEMEIVQCLFDNLFRTDNTGQLVPCLATEVPTQANGGVSADGLTYRVRLRRGVKWHDGEPFTAADVVFTVAAMVNPKVPVFDRTPYETLTSAKADGDYEVTIRVSRPSAKALDAFALPGILPSHLFVGLAGDALAAALGLDGVLASHPIGTGPFRLKSYDPIDAITLEANPDYFMGRPGVRTITWVDSNDEAAAVRAGTATMAHVQPTDYQGLANSLPPALKATKEESSSYLALIFNASSPALADRLVRQALAHAIGREDMVRAAGKGAAALAASIVPQGSWFRNPAVADAYSYDPAAARDLLARTGWQKSFGGLKRGGQALRVRVLTCGDSEPLMSAAQTVLRAWDTLGVATQLDSRSWFDLESAMEGGDYDALLVEWFTYQNFDGYSLSHRTMVSADPEFEFLPFCHLDGANLARALRSYASAVGRDDMRKAALDVQADLADEMVVLPVYRYWTYEIRPAALSGFEPSPYANGDFWNAWEWHL